MSSIVDMFIQVITFLAELGQRRQLKQVLSSWNRSKVSFLSFRSLVRIIGAELKDVFRRTNNGSSSRARSIGD